MSQRDDDLQREIRQHLELEAAERQADGLAPDAARREAARAFGNVTRIREEAREVWIAAWLQHLIQDLRYAARLARRNLGFTLGAVLMLALGISASSTIFGAINAVVLAPLPFDRPAQLVRLTQTNQARNIDAFSVSLPLYRDWRRLNTTFAGMAARRDGTVTVQGLGDPLQVAAQFVTHDLLPMLGLHALIGRDFRPEDDVPGAAEVVLLTESFWRTAFAADAGAIGRTLAIDGRPHRIVGVVSDDIRVTGDAEVLVPVVPHTEDRRGFSDLDVYARLKPGVPIGRAASEMAAIERQIQREYPDGDGEWSVRVEPLSDAIIGHTTPRMLYLLLAAVGALLLVACANLSGLLLVRAHARTREIAIRTAIGGGRGRIVRQLLTESVLLAAIGGASGVALSYAGVSVLRTFAMTDVPRAAHIHVDGWVLIFALSVSALAGILAGLAPARQATTLDVQRGIKEGAPSVMRGGSFMRNALIIGQLAVSIALLASAGLAIHALTRLSTMDLGFTPGQIVTMQIAPRTNGEAFVSTLLERLRARPDVISVAATSGAPMSSGNTSLNVYPVSPAAIPTTQSVQSDWRIVSTGYFSAMETPLIAGRDFTPHDDGNAPKAIVVNETLARRIWGDVSPVGKQVDLGGGGGKPATVIGLVRDVRNHTPAQLPSPTYYMSAYRGIYGPMTLVVRTRSSIDALLPVIRTEVSALDPTLPVFTVKTMDELVNARLAPQRLVAALLAGFALMALLLAVVGIYGAMAFATGQRTREVALRLALGATRWDVIRPLLREGSMLVLAGVALGCVIAVPLTRLMRTLLGDVSPNDPLAFIGAIVVLGSTTLLACYLPARRASRVNAVQALRGE